VIRRRDSRPPDAGASGPGAKRSVIALVAGAGLVAACAGIARVPDLVSASRSFLVLFTVAFACYAAAVVAMRNLSHSSRWVLALVLGVAFAARLVLLPTAPTLSTDAYRYVWDARVAAAGIDPYAYEASAPELAHLRDARVYPRLNHASWRTIYPPGAQALFRSVYALVPDSVLAMKAAIALGEIAALALLLVVLARLGLPLHRVALYAWNPLLLVEIWGSGHLDGLVLPAIVGALLAAVAGRPVLVGALLAAGTLVKLYPVVLLPMLGLAALERAARRRAAGERRDGDARAWSLGASAIAAFIVVIVAGYAPVLSHGSAALGSLPRYLGEEYFNVGLVRAAMGHPSATRFALVLWIAWATWWRRGEPLGARARRLAGGFTALQPNVFPWYAVWMVPFLALAPSSAWVAFTGTIALAYTFFLDVPWTIPAWARVVEFTPVVVAAVASLMRLRPGALDSSGDGRKDFTTP
jgi:alpha-1,6-mannosyltransferase